MSWDRFFVFGAGRHGKVVADVVLAAGIAHFEGFIDDAIERRGQAVLGLPVLGDRAWLEALLQQGVKVGLAHGIGESSKARERIGRALGPRGVFFPAVVHPRAVVAASARLGPGTVVMANASVNPDARIGEGCIVNTGAVVEHDVVLEDFSTIAPNATTGGGVRLGTHSRLGLGATVLPDLTIGAHTEIGAGSVVSRSIPDGVVAFGVPAKVVRKRHG